jgi:SAM-dependent methyltransferase
MSNAAHQWTQFYTGTAEMMYPAEAVIRIFKGSYSGLRMPKPQQGQCILDVGCGDGRHFPLFHSLGLAVSASEITEEIVTSVIERFPSRPKIDVRVGTCADLPWPDASFAYLLTWNSCYYVGPEGKFEDHVAEMARVMRPGGWLICSVPKITHEILAGADFRDDGYCIVRGDRFGLRNGERFRWFEDREGLEVAFVSHFTDFCYASIHDDFFDHNYHWHVIVAQRT